jgi:hypothetical protein
LAIEWTIIGLWLDGTVGRPGESCGDKELMNDDDVIQRLAEIERTTNGKPSYVGMDAAFCARMHAAITAGLECAPTGVITTPGTENPRYVSDVAARYQRQRNEW